MAAIIQQHPQTTQQQQPQQQQQQPHSIQTLYNSTQAHSLSGLGLLTTVASLPPKYRSRYLNIKTKSEIPLDLSVKPLSPHHHHHHHHHYNHPQIVSEDVPVASSFTEVKTEHSPTNTSSPLRRTPPVNNVDSTIIALEMQNHIKPMTPPLTPIKRSFADLEMENTAPSLGNVAKINKIDAVGPTQKTPNKPIRVTDKAPRTGKHSNPTPVNKMSLSSSTSSAVRHKATRKLKFDEDTSSPVSGTIIRPLEDITAGSVQYSNGDIDPKYNIVEITEETKAELAAIKNVIGDYVCKLCRLKFEDAFGLAQHRCACIVLLEYRCPECGKQFNCPANLASHRRWHKPRKVGSQNTTTNGSSKLNNNSNKKENTNAVNDSELKHECGECGKKFKRPAYLRKHQLTHNKNNPPTNVANTTEVNVVRLSDITPTEVNLNGNDATHLYTAYEDNTSSECSSSTASSSKGYGRLQIIENDLTEEENIAAAALTNLRNCASVIQHTTFAH